MSWSHSGALVGAGAILCAFVTGDADWAWVAAVIFGLAARAQDPLL